MSNKTKAVICILGSGFCFSLMTVFIRLASDVPLMERTMFRNLIAAVLTFFILLKSKSGFRIGKGNVKYLLARSIFGTVGMVCNFYAVDHLLLSDANMLNKLSPFFAILASYFLLKEKLKPMQIIGVVVAFLGSLLIIKPSGSAGMDLLPSILGVIGGVGAGIAYTFVRLLGTRGENSKMVVFFFSAFSCISLLPFVIATYKPVSEIEFLYLCATGICACGGQLCITQAYTYAPAREISVYDYAQVIFSSAFGFFFFAQVPDGYSILGYFIIIGMAVLMFLYNNGKLGGKVYENKQHL